MRLRGERRRPSWSTIGAVLLALYVGATCGCTTIVATPPVQTIPVSCVILATTQTSDTITVGFYVPPCDANADSVFYWRLPMPRACAVRATIDAKAGYAKVQTACPPEAVGLEV